jgi:tol-pal system protein YbgF
MKNRFRLIVLTLLLSNVCCALAARTEAPVVDLSRSQEPSVSQGLEVDQDDAHSMRINSRRNESMDQKVLRLERQVSNLAEMNFASKLEKLQQEIQALRGQIEVQNHDISQLKDQVRNFYQDLDQRVSKIQPDQSSNTEKANLNAENDDKKLSKDSVTTDSATNKTKELQTYEAAFNLLNKKDYDKAINGFQDFIKAYPNSSYSVNAHYWLGEIYYLKTKPDQATKEFQTIITNYPDSPKVADALLKIALIAIDAGNYTKAKTNLLKVQKQFPGTTAAKIATLRLKEIKQKP